MNTDLKFPTNFRHEVVNQSREKTVLWADIKSSEKCIQWISEFSAETNTSWILRRSKTASKKRVCRREYCCHHSSFNKSKTTQKSSKNLNCQASISIAIKVQTKWICYRNKQLRDLPALITINNIHTHVLSNAEALGYLPATNQLRSVFEKYFNDGMGITEACNFHNNKLELEMDEGGIANASVNPKYRTVKYWYTEWRKINFGARTGVGSLEKLKEKVPDYEMLGVSLHIKEDPFSVIIITPIMRRAHNLPCTKDIIFIDSTSSCDAENHVITFVLTVTSAGAVPLGVFITQNQTSSDYIAGLSGIKEILGVNAFGGVCPKSIMTDDSEAERQALRVIFPSSKLLLCTFHVSQSIWRWLLEKKHSIEKEDRQLLYRQFKNILISLNIEAAENNLKSALSIEINVKYPNWVSYLQTYWERRHAWCLAYRDSSTHGHQTNNFSEICVRLYKDIVLNRCKAYNVVALVDFTCTVLEQYYVRRFRNFAHGRVPTKNLLHNLLQKTSYLTKENIIQINEYNFQVPSSKCEQLFYDVDMSMGHCSCASGILGKLCKHQAALFSFYSDPIATEANDRYSMAVLALGDNAKEKDFYAPLLESKSSCLNNPALNEIGINYENYDAVNAGHENTETQSVPESKNANNNEFENFLDALREQHTKFGLYTEIIHDAHETIPKKVTQNGDHITHNLTTYHEQEDETHHFNISIENENRTLILKPSVDFLSLGLIIERRKRDAHVRYRPSGNTKNCHFYGSVYGQPESKVALSLCNGMMGMVQNKYGKYYIEPAHHHVKTINPKHTHLVYKRSAVSTKYPKRKRKKKRKKPNVNCGTREPKKGTQLEWHKQYGKLRIQERRPTKHKRKIQISGIEESQLKTMRYKNVNSNNRKRRSVSQPHYVETLVVADVNMAEFHQDGDIETYILTIMNMVSSVYQDPSLGNYIQVVVVKIIIIDEADDDDFKVQTNADVTLKNFCKWQKSLNPVNDSHPHHHDVAVLMTRKDICARNDTPCGTLGVAHVAGMCKTMKSCSVNEDNGISAAHTIAHEMGHNFGMLHDTDQRGCKKRQGNRSNIMTPSFEADTISVSWSECSRREITNFLDKGLGKCLQDLPEDIEEYEYPELPAGAMYNADHQCRLHYGENASMCAPLDEICFRLWCLVNNSCITMLRPAAPGTNCGKHKWCQDQKCVPMMEPQVPIDGGWGEWSAWSECSRTCGSGVSIMQRECDHPTPAAGGKYCLGERKRYRICNNDPCPENQPNYRASQCSWYNNKTYEGRKYAWHPYFDQGDPCQLYCSDVNETIIVPWGDYAADGTPCNVVSRDVCITGICKNVGCDWVVDSEAKEDDCGICQGDGTKCEKFSGTYQKQSYHPGYREIVVIPAGARNIRIIEKERSDNFISIESAMVRRYYLNGKRHITLPGEYNIANTSALYERENNLEKIKIPGPIHEAILVSIFFTGKTYNPGVEWKYALWKPETTKEVKYSWILGDWSQCSTTCAGGTQHRQPVCQESTVSTVASELDSPTNVEDDLCEPSEKPTKLVRTCNEDPCPYHWWVGPWQTCSKTCLTEEENALRHRSVMCVDGQEVALPDQFCNKKDKPIEYEPCVKVPLCE